MIKDLGKNNQAMIYKQLSALLYRNIWTIWNLDLAKAPGFDLPKGDLYYNIERFLAVKSREPALKSKTKFSIGFGIWALLCCCCSCQEEPAYPVSDTKPIPKGEYIYRKHDEYYFRPPPPEKKSPPAYFWDKGTFDGPPKITKEYFRCKGSSLNPIKSLTQNGDTVKVFDCGGLDKHSLPVRDGKEFVFPILIDLLNYIQTKSGKRVVITSGHRCPDHNTYNDASASNRYSKHMVGAEVSFYVQGVENSPESVLALIEEYYKETPKYAGIQEYQEFKRWEKKEDTDVSIPPRYNKEIFVKVYQKSEGRDFDNRHPYPYLSIQVRYDMEKGERVAYTWEKAFHSYMRW